MTPFEGIYTETAAIPQTSEIKEFNVGEVDIDEDEEEDVDMGNDADDVIKDASIAQKSATEESDAITDADPEQSESEVDIEKEKNIAKDETTAQAEILRQKLSQIDGAEAPLSSDPPLEDATEIQIPESSQPQQPRGKRLSRHIETQPLAESVISSRAPSPAPVDLMDQLLNGKNELMDVIKKGVAVGPITENMEIENDNRKFTADKADKKAGTITLQKLSLHAPVSDSRYYVTRRIKVGNVSQYIKGGTCSHPSMLSLT